MPPRESALRRGRRMPQSGSCRPLLPPHAQVRSTGRWCRLAHLFGQRAAQPGRVVLSMLPRARRSSTLYLRQARHQGHRCHERTGQSHGAGADRARHLLPTSPQSRCHSVHGLDPRLRPVCGRVVLPRRIEVQPCRDRPSTRRPTLPPGARLHATRESRLGRQNPVHFGKTATHTRLGHRSPPRPRSPTKSRFCGQWPRSAPQSRTLVHIAHRSLRFGRSQPAQAPTRSRSEPEPVLPPRSHRELWSRVAVDQRPSMPVLQQPILLLARKASPSTVRIARYPQGAPVEPSAPSRSSAPRSR